MTRRDDVNDLYEWPNKIEDVMTVLFWIVGRQLPKCWKK